MTDRRKQLRVGIFAIISAALVAVVLIIFGGMRFWKHHDRYVVEFDDSVMGLEKGAPVYMNGIKCGTVGDIRLAPDDLSRVRIEVSLDEGTPVHTDTHAFLSLAGITGLKVIDLKGGSLTSPLTPPDGTIVAGVGTLDKLQKKAEQLADQTGQIMDRANKIFDAAGKVADGANQLMVNLNASVDPKMMAAIMGSTRQASENLVATTADMHALVAENRKSLKTSLDTVALATKSAQDLMDNQVVAMVANANDLIGDMRGVVHSNENVLQSAMSDIRQASRSFKDLAREVKEKPSRLLFSATQPERKLP